MDEQKTVPPIPSHMSDDKTLDSTEDVEQFKKTQDHVERLVSDMGDAVDVIHFSPQNDNQFQETEETSYSEQYNRTIPNISIFDSTPEDFPVELNSDVVEDNKSMSDGKVKSDKVIEPGIFKGQEDKPVPSAARTDDYLEYRADDSDRVYAVRNSADGENFNDKESDPDKLFDGSSVQHNFSNKVIATNSGEVIVESEIPTQLRDHTPEEVRVK